MDCIKHICSCDVIICNNEVEHSCEYNIALKITDNHFICAKCLQLRINNNIYTIVEKEHLDNLREELTWSENCREALDEQRRYTH